MKHKKAQMVAAGIAIALISLFFGCNKKKSLTQAEAVNSSPLDGAGNAYVVDTTASVIEWIGSTPGNYKHTGTIKLMSGKLTAKDDHLTGGSFVINMNSILNTDQTGKDKSNLEKHLKNGDFFEVEKFPFGDFKLTNAETESSSQSITGNLTLKSITKSIQIPIELKIEDQTLTAQTPMFSIDRTKWGVVYSSGIIGTLKDDLINDEISLKIKIVAKHQ
jgi:polyisoprenoid-binding protein YceI